MKTLENLKQIHYATVSCGLNKPGTENANVQKSCRSLEVIPEKANDEKLKNEELTKKYYGVYNSKTNCSQMEHLLCTH